MAKIYSIRKGSVQWNEDDRLELVKLLAKCGYGVRIGRQPVKGKEGKNVQQEYYVEYTEGGNFDE